MPAKIPDEVVAQILAESDYYTDVQLSARWGVSVRSIERYRKRATEDPVLTGIVGQKRKILQEQWSVNATACLNAALIEMRRRFSLAATKENAEMILAIAASVKIVGELRIAIDALRDTD
ncbi:hypothetical protein WA1_51605 [Scytonema hofmannii PCC 7110]|uniref:Uncharacterized protein n=1 Tax=Scytonema hofmannii PCC 7110 TaxID=128403 RepID=A0A139WPY4_9CYAN|nr:hypothetical protein [Scytonema hofmannii]KYC34491.1 hypothetical protein WA1_51605 [Scytonema hofmannii PCC 7110]